MKRPRLQLHATGVTTFTTCPEAFRRRYIAGHKIAPGSRLIVGRGTDDAVGDDLAHKIEHKADCAACNLEGLEHNCLLSEDAVTDRAAETVRTAFTVDVSLEPEERRAGKDRVAGAAVDKAVRLSRHYHRHLAPQIKIAAVREKWTISLDDFLKGRGVSGVKMDFVGERDQRENDDGLIRIRDLKTSAKSPSEDVAERSIQMSSYALADLVEHGRLPDDVVLDYLVDLKGGVEWRPRHAGKDKADIAALMNRIEIIVRSLKAGIFPPTSRDSWKCSAKWCGYYPTCPYTKNPVSITLSAPKPQFNKIGAKLFDPTPADNDTEQE